MKIRVVSKCPAKTIHRHQKRQVHHAQTLFFPSVTTGLTITVVVPLLTVLAMMHSYAVRNKRRLQRLPRKPIINFCCIKFHTLNSEAGNTVTSSSMFTCSRLEPGRRSVNQSVWLPVCSQASRQSVSRSVFLSRQSVSLSVFLSAATGGCPSPPLQVVQVCFKIESAFFNPRPLNPKPEKP